MKHLQTFESFNTSSINEGMGKIGQKIGPPGSIVNDTNMGIVTLTTENGQIALGALAEEDGTSESEFVISVFDRSPEGYTAISAKDFARLIQAYNKAEWCEVKIKI